MKFMKLGTRPDTFYTEEATRTVLSDAPSDLTIHINNITYLLHKFPLLPRCGLLQVLCTESEDSGNVTLKLHDLPGGEDAFELCAKFCYGITINLSAHNFVSAFCAAKFLRMTEAVDKGNFVLKLEAFFSSCILDGWKDSVVALQTTAKLPEWSENFGIIRRCIDSIVEKILTPPSKVNWSYTYTRPGYAHKRNQPVPKDWWTEDISDLHIDLFRCIVTAIRSTNMLPPQLIGEALHVYACRWLPDTTRAMPPESSATQTDESLSRKRRVLESIVSMIPADQGSVSIRFLLRLLSISNFLGASPMTRTELIRQCGVQFEEATLNDLLIPSQSSEDHHFYDIDLVGAVLESFLMQWRRQSPVHQNQYIALTRKIGKLIDSYLQVVSSDPSMPVQKIVSLAQALPDIARPEHDDLYKAINIYLKEHPDMAKAEKRQLCSVLDCQKLSPQVCAHAVKNERLPLRTVVQVLFFEREGGTRATSKQKMPTIRNNMSKLRLNPDEQSSRADIMRRNATPAGLTEVAFHRLKKSPREKLQQEPEQNIVKEVAADMESERKRESKEEGISGSKLDPRKIMQRGSKSEQGYSKGRER